MNEYFTLESVRDQFQQVGINGLRFTGGTFPPDWRYCPCLIIESCRRLNNIICSTPIYIGIFLRTPNISIPIVVEIIYERETSEGFIRANNMKLKELSYKNIINIETLKKVTKPF